MFAQATRRALGAVGVVLAAAVAGSVVWLLFEQQLVSARTATGVAWAVLIVVGVALDTMTQMQQHLLLRKYDGFMKKGGRVRRYAGGGSGGGSAF